MHKRYKSAKLSIKLFIYKSGPGGARKIGLSIYIKQAHMKIRKILLLPK
jgi:hypothetical protein